MNRGEVWWYELPELGRRPGCILTRQAAVPLLNAVLVAPATRTIRDIPTEVRLGPDGMSESQAHAILQRADIKPHLTEQWIMSDFTDPEFEPRLREVCGLYVAPPENVLVVSIDEKTGIQAKSPIKPDTPPRPGHVSPPGASTNTSETAPSACSPA